MLTIPVCEVRPLGWHISRAQTKLRALKVHDEAFLIGSAPEDVSKEPGVVVDTTVVYGPGTVHVSPESLRSALEQYD